MPTKFIGIDVQASRGCPFAVLDGSATMVESGWLSLDGFEREVLQLVERHPDASVGIDSPRMPLPRPREWYWRRGRWIRRAVDEGFGHGRHCEVVVKAHGLANPQWTPTRDGVPGWMSIGFRIFEALSGLPAVHEVFPSASYKMLKTAPDATVTLSFETFEPGPKDMLDAIIGALTALEFRAGRGSQVGGGDGLGTILLPRPLAAPIPAVLSWPAG